MSGDEGVWAARRPQRPRPCSEPWRSDRGLPGGRELDGPRSGPGLRTGGGEEVAGRSKASDLSPSVPREGGKERRGTSGLQIALGARSQPLATAPEDARGVFSGDVEVGLARASEATGAWSNPAGALARGMPSPISRWLSRVRKPPAALTKGR